MVCVVNIQDQLSLWNLLHKILSLRGPFILQQQDSLMPERDIIKAFQVQLTHIFFKMSLKIRTRKDATFMNVLSTF